MSPYEYWQFWRNTEDADVGRFLRLFTELDIAAIERSERGDINEAKKVLATEATALCHGRDAAEAAADTARLVFESGGSGDALPQTEFLATCSRKASRYSNCSAAAASRLPTAKPGG